MARNNPRTMRDVLIERICRKMQSDKSIFFISADFGAPALDELKQSYPDRFINVGIAEQNLINVSTGLAIEGFTVYAYAIAGFITMRAYEQIRINLALSAQLRDINVNLIGVGAGVSYDLSGPTHHCLEDISIVRTLPNIILCSPCDWVTTENFVDFSIDIKKPKYLRLDSKPLTEIYPQGTVFDWDKGCCELIEGDNICIISTGYMTRQALDIAEELDNVGVIDIFVIKPANYEYLHKLMKKYKFIITAEEGFKDKGGMDSLITNIMTQNKLSVEFMNFGFDDKYIFESGSRDVLYETANFGNSDIIRAIKQSGYY